MKKDAKVYYNGILPENYVKKPNDIWEVHEFKQMANDLCTNKEWSGCGSGNNVNDCANVLGAVYPYGTNNNNDGKRRSSKRRSSKRRSSKRRSSKRRSSNQIYLFFIT